MNKRIFNSVGEIKDVYGVDVNIPDYLPDGCNVVSYYINGLYSIQFFDCYKLDEFGLYIFADFEWRLTHNSIEDEVCEDMENGYNYIYLHITQQDNKEKFTPKRLLGVLTDHGYIQDVGILYVTTTGYHYCTLDTLKFYTSDDSDETVSFDEYVDLFYERE